MLSDDDGGDIDGILAINQINYNQLVGPVDVYIYINYGFAFFFCCCALTRVGVSIATAAAAECIRFLSQMPRCHGGR